jgi:hypothetical protein
MPRTVSIASLSVPIRTFDFHPLILDLLGKANDSDPFASSLATSRRTRCRRTRSPYLIGPYISLAALSDRQGDRS